MRVVLKILAAPVLGLLTLAVAVCSFVLMIAGIAFWILTVLAAIGGIVLLVTNHIAGGIAFLVISFLVSPYGLPALFAWLVGKLDALRYLLKEFITG
jgi:hypothetical protein